MVDAGVVGGGGWLTLTGGGAEAGGLASVDATATAAETDAGGVGSAGALLTGRCVSGPGVVTGATALSEAGGSLFVFIIVSSVSGCPGAEVEGGSVDIEI